MLGSVLSTLHALALSILHTLALSTLHALAHLIHKTLWDRYYPYFLENWDQTSLIDFPSVIQLSELLDLTTKYSLSTYYIPSTLSASYLPTAMLCAFLPHFAAQVCCQDGDLGPLDRVMDS